MSFFLTANYIAQQLENWEQLSDNEKRLLTLTLIFFEESWENLSEYQAAATVTAGHRYKRGLLSSEVSFCWGCAETVEVGEGFYSGSEPNNVPQGWLYNPAHMFTGLLCPKCALSADGELRARFLRKRSPAASEIAQYAAGDRDQILDRINQVTAVGFYGKPPEKLD